MKIQIRQSVFETNSSHNDTMNMTSKPLDDIYFTFFQYYLKQKRDWYKYRIEDYIIDDVTFTMPQLHVQADTDLESNTRFVYIYESLGSKIAFVASYLWTTYHHLKDWFEWRRDDKKELITKEKFILKLNDWFVTYLLKYLKKCGYHQLENIEWDIQDEYESYYIQFPETYNDKDIDLEPELSEFIDVFDKFKEDVTEEEFCDILDKLFADDFKIVEHQSPYHAERLEIKTF